jgi:general secretion pathway protein M
MTARLRIWWLGLARRERGMVLTAAVVAAAVALYALAIEPAWLTRARIARELPPLQAQLAEIEALREEARLLRQQGFGTDSSGTLRAGAERSLARTGISATVVAEGERAITVTASKVPAPTWFGWMEEFGREARVRVARARVARAGSPGVVEAEAGFEVPAR